MMTEDDAVTRFVTMGLAGMERLHVDFHDWIKLHMAECELIRHLVLIPSGDMDVDAHVVRTAPPSSLLRALHELEGDDARDRLAALLYAFKTVETCDEGHRVIDRLEQAWMRGQRT